MDKKVLALSKKYTDETVVGGGAIKGKNCTVDSITDITDGKRVTFKWTLDDGTVLTGTMDVMNGDKGDTGTSITEITAEGNFLVIALSDGTTERVEIPTVEANALDDLSDVELSELSDGQTLVYDAEAQKWVNGEGAGDMEKRIYDTDNDGVVDNSEQLEGHGASYFATASDLTAHAASTAAHVSASERTKWDGYESQLYSLPKFTASLPSNGWTDQTGYYTQTVAVTGMTASLIPAVYLSTTAGAKDEDLEEAFGHLYRVESGSGTLTFYADEEPTENISLIGFMIKEAS